MAEQATTEVSARKTRRQLLGGGTGAVAAVLAGGALARPAPALAANGDPVLLGRVNMATGPTTISNRSGSSALEVGSVGLDDTVPAAVCGAGRACFRAADARLLRRPGGRLHRCPERPAGALAQGPRPRRAPVAPHIYGPPDRTSSPEELASSS